MTAIKIYVANLGKYNEGKLVGQWFTLPHDLEDIRVKIGVAHYNEDGDFIPYVEDGIYMYEEWAIHDYEAPFTIKEYDSIDRLNEIATELGNAKIDDCILEAIISCVSDIDEALEIISNQDYRTYDECSDMGEVAHQYYDETGLLDDIEKVINSNYIDWDAIGRDMELEGSFEYYSDGMHYGYIEIFN